MAQCQTGSPMICSQSHPEHITHTAACNTVSQYYHDDDDDDDDDDEVGDFSVATAQHKRQVCNKLARAKVRCVCCVVSFSKFHYNDLLATS